MQWPSEARARHAAHYAFETLHALPCGCVAAIYRARPGEIEVVSVEARGPHCLDSQHVAGRVLGLAVEDSERLNR